MPIDSLNVVDPQVELHYFKNKFQSYGNIEKQDAYHVIYKLDKNLFPALDKTLYICFLYIPPMVSIWRLQQFRKTYVRHS